MSVSDSLRPSIILPIPLPSVVFPAMTDRIGDVSFGVRYWIRWTGEPLIQCFWLMPALCGAWQCSVFILSGASLIRTFFEAISKLMVRYWIVSDTLKRIVIQVNHPLRVRQFTSYEGLKLSSRNQFCVYTVLNEAINRLDCSTYRESRISIIYHLHARKTFHNLAWRFCMRQKSCSVSKFSNPKRMIKSCCTINICGVFHVVEQVAHCDRPIWLVRNDTTCTN